MPVPLPVNPLLEALNYPPKKDQTPQSAPEKAPPAQENEAEYTEEDLESFIPSTTDASYFEKAQDFRPIIKILRIKYLGLKPFQKTLPDGSTMTVYRKDNKNFTGINEAGVEGNVRFLETRLGKHTILSNWDEKRMYEVLKDDMYAWLDMMEQNYEVWGLTGAAMLELRILVNDLLEFTYRRPMENKERGEFKPVSNEIRRIMDKLGIMQPQQDAYPQSMVEQAQKDLKY